jgi:hypothetical protein
MAAGINSWHQWRNEIMSSMWRNESNHGESEMKIKLMA